MTPPPTLLVGQSGGPTAVINASLSGVLEAALARLEVSRVLGMRQGIQGLLEGQVVKLDDVSPQFRAALPCTPSAVLGSCRFKLEADNLERVVSVLRRENVRWLLYIGGNDSADSSHQIDLAARRAGLPLAVIGVPKTIDNDLPFTDHCPGYGSAARFVAQVTAEIGVDTETMRRTDPIKILEVMGRHAGWLAAAAWLGKRDAQAAPHLVYLPERPVAEDVVLAEVETVYRQRGYCVVVLCENQPEPHGRPIGASGAARWVDSFGHRYHDSPAQHLAGRITREMKVRARFDKPGTIQRSSAAHVSSVDREHAAAVGRRAVDLALSGSSGVMVTIERDSDDPYGWSLSSAPLELIANVSRHLPDRFISEEGRQPSAAFERYARPLLGGPLPELAYLRG
ncbi:MAG: diphosphate--fructose-6-phosphate 1-phosphotransferase [Chloroflexi bacterium]|nr:diphosphate--fructose-6-phosphate 1-phosphotransferase [Chloroflexota bacterium]